MKAIFLFAVILIFLANCKKKEDAPPPQNTQITVSDHSDSLKTAGYDTLFTLSLNSAQKTYVLNDLTITAALPGETQNLLNFTLKDANGNNQFDQGETMICREPSGNIFDASHISKNINVYFLERQSNGNYYQVATLVWTPTN